AVFADFLVLLVGLTIWSLAETAHGPRGLMFAAKRGWLGAVDRALANGVSPDSWVDQDQTLLMWAAGEGTPEVVKRMLLYGADVGLRNRFGQTATDIARARGHADILALLASPPQGKRQTVAQPSPAPRADLLLLATALLGALAYVPFAQRA